MKLVRTALLLGLSFCVYSTTLAQNEIIADTTAAVETSEGITFSTPKKYPSLLWQVSGNGLKKPSYLYGTMHVSRKMVFRLTDSFFKALYSADVVALESDANKWIDELAQDGYGRNRYYRYNRNGFYNSAFVIQYPKKSTLEYLLQREEELADAMMYRKSDKARNFSEEQFLDMFIHQAGMKLGKTVTGLEDFKVSRKMVAKSRKKDSKKDKDEKKKKKRIDYYGEEGVYEQIENAYRNGDLDLLDSLEILTAPSKNFLKWMLWERNKVMVRSYDSIVKSGKILFAGVGAAHVPGDSGVVEMLRRMGYTVRPVIGKTNRWAGKQKDNIDQLQFKHNMQPFQSHHGDFSAQMPGVPMDYSQGNITEYFYPDMANGAYYKVTRLPYYGSFSNQTASHVLNRIDSLLFENIPGKILVKKQITRNGHAGIEIQNRTSLGDYQRYLIVATPINLWVIKMAGQKEFAKSRQAEQFFNSIQILEKNESNWQKYSPPNGVYEVNWPTFISNKKSVRDTSKTLADHENIDAIDKNGNYYFVRNADLDLDFNAGFEEDSFELNELILSLSNGLKAKNLQHAFSPLKGIPASIGQFYSTTANCNVYVKTVMLNNRFFLVGCKHNDSAAAMQFIQSFKPVQYRYHVPFGTYQDSALHFKTTTLTIDNKKDEEEDDDDDMYSGWGYSSSEDEDDINSSIKDSLGILSTYKSKNYTATTGEKIELFRFISGIFDTEEPVDSLIAPLNRHLKSIQGKLLRTDSWQKGGWNFVKVLVSDTNTCRQALKIWAYRQRDYYVMSTRFDSAVGLSPFLAAFITGFEPTDTLLRYPIAENNKVDSLLRGIFHSDSIVRRLHRKALAQSNVNFKKEHVPALINALKKLNKYQEKNLEKYTYEWLLEKISTFKTKEGIALLSETYKQAGDTAEKQIDVLTMLANMKSEAATKEFVKSIIDETPLSSNSYSLNGLFTPYADSLQYAKNLYPDIFNLLRYDEYKEDVLNIASKLLDSGYIKPAQYAAFKTDLLMEFRDDWKRNMASDSRAYNSWEYGSSEEEDKEDEEQYHRFDNEKTSNKLSGSDRSSKSEADDKLTSMGKLLLPYYREEDVKKRLDKTWQTGSRPDRFEWVLLMLNNGIQLPDSVIRKFAGRCDYQWELASAKLPKSADSIRRFLDTPKNLARVFLSSRVIGPKDSMVFLGNRSIDHPKRKGTVYFFKHTYKKGYEDEWYLDYVMIPENGKVIPGKKDPDYWVKNKPYPKNKDTKEVIDAQMEYLMKYDRIRWEEKSENSRRYRSSYSIDY
jgi:uncharacterized protein YbaP (TraB family)